MKCSFIYKFILLWEDLGGVRQGKCRPKYNLCWAISKYEVSKSVIQVKLHKQMCCRNVIDWLDKIKILCNEAFLPLLSFVLSTSQTASYSYIIKNYSKDFFLGIILFLCQMNGLSCATNSKQCKNMIVFYLQIIEIYPYLIHSSAPLCNPLSRGTPPFCGLPPFYISANPLKFSARSALSDQHLWCW